MSHALTEENFTVEDLIRPEVIANPYPWYALLRDQAPQFGLKDYPPGTMPEKDEPYPAWAFLKFDDVRAVMKNHKAFSSRDPMQEASDAPTLQLVNHDEPRHRVLRNLAKQAFTPKRVETDVAPWVAEQADRMIKDMRDGEVEFMEAYAKNLPALVMTKLIGTPTDDYKLLRRWANAFMVTSTFTLEERGQCIQELGAYYMNAVAERYQDIEAGKQVPDDLMTAFIRAEDEGETLTREEVTLFCITLVVAGAETSTYLLGNLAATLAEEPQFFDQLKNDRSLVRPFIEESLRRDGPPQRLFRLATQDIEVGGAQVKEGDWVAFFMGAANRDPAQFEKPDEFILNRPNVTRHLTFGHGIHSCLGAGIARLEAELTVNGILDRCSALTLGNEPMQRQNGGLLAYGHERCPVVLKS